MLGPPELHQVTSRYRECLSFWVPKAQERERTYSSANRPRSRGPTCCGDVHSSRKSSPVIHCVRNWQANSPTREIQPPGQLQSCWPLWPHSHWLQAPQGWRVPGGLPCSVSPFASGLKGELLTLFLHPVTSCPPSRRPWELRFHNAFRPNSTVSGVAPPRLPVPSSLICPQRSEKVLRSGASQL